MQIAKESKKWCQIPPPERANVNILRFVLSNIFYEYVCVKYKYILNVQEFYTVII